MIILGYISGFLHKKYVVDVLFTPDTSDEYPNMFFTKKLTPNAP